MTATAARHQAHGILSKPPYTKTPSRPGLVSRILNDIGRWIEDAVRPVWHWVDRELFHPVHVALGDWWPIPVAIVCIAMGLLGSRFVVHRRVRHRRRGGDDGVATASATTDPDPEDLERDAAAAEHDGRLSDAVRLRFLAGLTRLERQGLIVDRSAGTDRTLARELGSPAFDRLATTHEAVTFADQEATGEDVAAAHQLWPRVPTEVRQARVGRHGDAI
jgi:hypothetical protein